MAQPLRVIEGNAQPGETFWRYVNAAQSQSGETEIEFFGPISEYSWFGDEITPKAFRKQLQDEGKGGPVTIKVNSPGGEVFAAAAIRAALQDYPGKVTADIVGLAASAATVVVSGADLVRMRDTAMFMIHDPSTIAWGTLEEMRQVVEVLSQVKETILNAYQAKTGLARDQLAQMMSDETWLTAQQAQEYGFVDQVVSEAKKGKLPKGVKAAYLNCLEAYDRAPDGLVDLVEEEEEVIPDEALTSEAQAADNEQREAQQRDAQALRERVQSILSER